MGFLAIVNAYTMRICLNVAITQMVKKKPYDDEGVSGKQFCPVNLNDTSSESDGGDFEWSESLQGIILGAFFWGYVS